ncbi:ABC transporter cysteine exporter CydD [Gluconobacter thailandicus F149-1 = NBRC 100600]|uniref:Transport ATP-binding protein CydD n=1 Tax=Gluconobacter thailandicus NBRC 3257 TaxID=1381097 RepID=A0ABQ0IS09_GLUTH|nr:thiol reductant ABC exporter subunit CydD [Gluconobacter thailandicus]KXV54291.1 ABC transporter ATP-binding protein [Gluconobacter thailandicus]GAC86814.1 transport ATP-binding protein CydD [Gluconobacter thailandicus NBRC 3255]GAD25003.1 transport ATP-binding protein CydD [Gluconobacter thailandicus NBRC 3257]GAN94547.1 ABC transporter cysteine exporter CydD [Gluconobacter thailandicus F149-1 = NBRC 100600]GBR59396.1 transport ATP-binding protein CydD [Gluconobacter thailandicus F149-1 = 
MKADKTIAKAWIKAQGRASRSSTSFVVILGLLSTLLGLMQAWALARTLASILTSHPGNAPPAIGLFLIVSVARTGLSVIQDVMASTSSLIARRRLRSDILARIIGEGPALLRRQHSSVIASTLVDRVEALDGYFARWLPASALWLVSQWIVVAAVFWQNHKAGIILAICCATLPVFQAVFGIATAVASRRQFLAMTRLQTRFLDRVKGIATIVLSGGTERETQALAKSADDLRIRTMKVLRIAFIASATTDVAMVAALVLIVITQSHSLTNSTPELTLTRALYAILLVPEAFASFRALSAAYQDRAHATAAAEAMHALEPIPNERAVMGAIATDAAHSLSITAKDLSFAWNQERGPVIHNVSFTLPAGETLILEGPSGSGKSTLLELLLGFVAPSEGRIFLGGQDMANMTPRQISSQISWIGQKPVLFAGTIRENILFAKPDASEPELDAAISAAAMDRYLPLLPAGLETRIGEGGFGLSGGQAQRIAIARAFLKNAPILLLDEPTSHLDPATEAEILDSLHRLTQGRTVVLCTHSAQARQFHGRHLVLNRGRAISYTEEAA